MEEDPALQALRRSQQEQDSAYAELLATIDTLSQFALPLERLPAMAQQQARLNSLFELPAPVLGDGLRGKHRASVWGVVGPALQRQQEFNAAGYAVDNLPQAVEKRGVNTELAHLVTWTGVDTILGPLADDPEAYRDKFEILAEHRAFELVRKGNRIASVR